MPVVVGGTGLYVRALLGGLFAAPEPDGELRRRLGGLDAAALHAELHNSDPEAAARIGANDRVRITRALEVVYLTGRPISQHQQAHGFQDGPYDCLRICVTRERQALYRRINRRVEQMLERGLVGEVRSLLAMGFDARLKPLQSIGYRQVLEHIEGRIGYAEAAARIQQETRRLAKRQLTWLRRDTGLVWITLPQQEHEILPLVQKFLE